MPVVIEYNNTVCRDCVCVMKALSDDVALHKVDIDEVCGMARMLAALCHVEMVTTEAAQIAARFHALMSSVQVTLALYLVTYSPVIECSLLMQPACLCDGMSC